jgi:hypothetical protein
MTVTPPTTDAPRRVPPPTLRDLPPPPPGRTGWPWTEASPALPATLPGGAPWPTISIVTPSYNQAHFLEETIRSVLLQGYPALEYLVLDGGSSDGSAAIIERYSPWLAFWRSGRDGGQSAAIAEGFERASGAVIAWLNSDDRYRPGALGRVGRYFAAHPRVVFANSDVNTIDSEGRLSHRQFVARPVRLITAQLGYHTWPQQGCFWRRDAYLRAGGVDRSLQFCMDRDLFLRLTALGPVGRLRGPATADFRAHEEAKSSRMLEVAAAEGAVLCRRYGNPAIGRLPGSTGALEALWWATQAWCGVRRRFAGVSIEI